MGQALWCYDCCWFAECHFCLGISWGLLCCNLWCCIPDDVRDYRGGECCKTGGCSGGCGGTFCCVGAYCLAPQWLQTFSLRTSIGNKRPNFPDIMIVDKQGGPQTNQNMYQN